MLSAIVNRENCPELLTDIHHPAAKLGKTSKFGAIGWLNLSVGRSSIY